MRLGIARTLVCAALAFALAIVAASVFTSHSLTVFMRHADALQDQAEIALMARRLNGLVLQVTMDTRGIYMSATPREAEKYTRPLMTGLDAASDAFAALERRVKTGELAELKSRLAAFIATRRRIVELVHEAGLRESRDFGDNDSVRDARVALNEVLDRFVETREKELAAIGVRLDQIQDQTESDLLWVAMAGILGGLTVNLIISRRLVVTPLVRITTAMRALAAGDLETPVPCLGRRDEIGEMAKALDVFKEQGRHIIALRSAQDAERRRSEEHRQAALRKLADHFETSIGNVVSAVASASSEMNSAATQMAKDAEQTSTRATEVAHSAEQTTASFQTVAAATEEISTSIAEIAEQVERSQQVSTQAKAEVSSTTTMVNALSEDVSRIGVIIDLITDIASQTNLLALNATIEAARAGEAGKGFSVVAGEVKSLATQTARATDQIVGHIRSVQDRTGQAVHAIGGISQTIDRLDEISTSVASAVQEQSAATREIARNVDESVTATREMSNSITEVETYACGAGAASRQLSTNSAQLHSLSDFLNTEVIAFLGQIRAGRDQRQLVAWDPALETGIGSIDDHHRTIFEDINAFYAAMMDGDGTDAGAGMLARVINDCERHFAEEEALMRREGYPQLEAHRAAHRAFMREIGATVSPLSEGAEGELAKFFEFSTGWLKQHIDHDDRAMALFVKERTPPAMAAPLAF